MKIKNSTGIYELVYLDSIAYLTKDGRQTTLYSARVIIRDDDEAPITVEGIQILDKNQHIRVREDYTLA